ncbi:hypothetical protein CL684_02950 [Candidatus Campbellbacteria bacterium]|nr:hypothetical protein [Candidatus Campbellbacteria bacterium]
MKTFKIFLISITLILHSCAAGIDTYSSQRRVSSIGTGVGLGTLVTFLFQGNRYCATTCSYRHNHNFFRSGYYTPPGRRISQIIECRWGLEPHPEFIWRGGTQVRTCAHYQHWRASRQYQPRYEQDLILRRDPCRTIKPFGDDVYCQYRRNVIHPKYIDECGETSYYCDYHCEN